MCRLQKCLFVGMSPKGQYKYVTNCLSLFTQRCVNAQGMKYIEAAINEIRQLF